MADSDLRVQLEAEPDAEPVVHVVVFDVNVWLDVADLLPTPFEWSQLATAVAKHSQDPTSSPDRRIDSARALAVCTSGEFVKGQRLEVWTSNHIDKVLVHKLQQPPTSAHPDDRGWGWSFEAAEDFLHDCVYDLVFRYGGTVAEIEIPHGNPPLSHEDGMVYRTVTQAGDGYPIRYCVTSDRHFRECEEQLPADVTMLYPNEWTALVRSARLRASMGALRPRIN